MKPRRLFATPLVTVLACGSTPHASAMGMGASTTNASGRGAAPMEAPRGNPPAPRPLDRRVIASPRREGDRLCFTIDAGTDSDVDTRWRGELVAGGKPIANTAFVIVRADKTTSYACGDLREVVSRTVRIYPPGSAQR